jgi:hypothetical protein
MADIETTRALADAIDRNTAAIRHAALPAHVRRARHEAAGREAVQRVFAAAKEVQPNAKADGFPSEFDKLTEKQSRYVLAKVLAGSSNAEAAQFAGYRSKSVENLKAIGWQLSRHPDVAAALASLHRLVAERDPSTTEPEQGI